MLTLIDLIQKAFHTQNSSPGEQLDSDCAPHDVSVVLFFCTLREILLTWFIDHLFWAQKISRPIFNRLLADNNTHMQRQNNLLPSLTGKKWNVLIEEEMRTSQLNYGKLKDLIQRAAEARNKFMHEANHWGFSRQLAEECIQNIWPLLNFYVALHNRYVHPLHYNGVVQL